MCKTFPEKLRNQKKNYLSGIIKYFGHFSFDENVNLISSKIHQFSRIFDSQINCVYFDE